MFTLKTARAAWLLFALLAACGPGLPGSENDGGLPPTDGGTAQDPNAPLCTFTPKAGRAQGRWVHPPAPDTVFDLGEADCSLVRNSKGEGRMLVLSFGTYAPATWRSRPWGTTPYVQVFAAPTDGAQLAQVTVSTGDGHENTLTGTYTGSLDRHSGSFHYDEGGWTLDLTVQCAASDVLDEKLLPPLPTRAPPGSALVTLGGFDWTWLLSGIRCEQTGSFVTIERDDRGSCELLNLRLISNPNQRILGTVTMPDFFHSSSDWFLKGFRRLDQSSPENGTLEVEREAPLRGFVSFPRGLGPDRVDFQCP